MWVVAMMLASLSQNHLKHLEICPRKFQLGYLDQLLVPSSPDLRESQAWGTQFHLVMQQRELGISVAPLLAANPELAEAVDKLSEAAPDLFQVEAEHFRQSEHRRTLAFGDFLLTVVYDLLIMAPDYGQIVDWKTYLKPRSKQDWQTRLYLYVLAETTDYSPTQLRMDYWFVRARTPETQELQPSRVTIPYSVRKHRQTQAELERLTRQLAQFMAADEPFPQVNLSAGHCSHCVYGIRCQRSSERYPLEAVTDLPSIDEIAEIPL